MINKADLIVFAQIFTTPFVAIVAAGIASIIQWRSLIVSNEKLRLDLFDRRLAIYELLHECLVTMINMNETEKMMMKIQDCKSKMRGAKFLFDYKTDTLISEITDKIYNYHAFIASNTDEESLTHKEKFEKLESMRKDIAGFTIEIDRRFSKFLTFKNYRA